MSEIRPLSPSTISTSTLARTEAPAPLESKPAAPVSAPVSTQAQELMVRDGFEASTHSKPLVDLGGYSPARLQQVGEDLHRSLQPTMQDVLTGKLYETFEGALRQPKLDADPSAKPDRNALIKAATDTVLGLPYDAKAGGDTTRVLNQLYKSATGTEVPPGQTLGQVLQTLQQKVPAQLLRDNPAAAAGLAVALNQLGFGGEFTVGNPKEGFSVKLGVPPRALQNPGALSADASFIQGWSSKHANGVTGQTTLKLGASGTLGQGLTQAQGSLQHKEQAPQGSAHHDLLNYDVSVQYKAGQGQTPPSLTAQGQVSSTQVRTQGTADGGAVRQERTLDAQGSVKTHLSGPASTSASGQVGLSTRTTHTNAQGNTLAQDSNSLRLSGQKGPTAAQAQLDAEIARHRNQYVGGELRASDAQSLKGQAQVTLPAEEGSTSANASLTYQRQQRSGVGTEDSRVTTTHAQASLATSADGLRLQGSVGQDSTRTQQRADGSSVVTNTQWGVSGEAQTGATPDASVTAKAGSSRQQLDAAGKEVSHVGVEGQATLSQSKGASAQVQATYRDVDTTATGKLGVSSQEGVSVEGRIEQKLDSRTSVGAGFQFSQDQLNAASVQVNRELQPGLNAKLEHNFVGNDTRLSVEGRLEWGGAPSGKSEQTKAKEVKTQS